MVTTIKKISFVLLALFPLAFCQAHTRSVSVSVSAYVPTEAELSGQSGSSSSYHPSVGFRGVANSYNKIVILKDGQIIKTTIINLGENFNISVGGFSSGNFIFSIYAENDLGNRSELMSFPIEVKRGESTEIRNIFFAPPTTSQNSIGDLNEDLRVNLIDFLIAKLWYKTPLNQNMIQKESSRLNADSLINLQDFSIIAFYWTG